jgi:hypothetical protein
MQAIVIKAFINPVQNTYTLKYGMSVLDIMIREYRQQ